MRVGSARKLEAQKNCSCVQAYQCPEGIVESAGGPDGATLRVPPSSTGTSGIRECKTSVISGR